MEPLTVHPLARVLWRSVLKGEPRQAFPMLSLCKLSGFPYPEGTTKICIHIFPSIRMMEKLCYSSGIKTIINPFRFTEMDMH